MNDAQFPSFCSQSTEALYHDNNWWMNLYTIGEDHERDYHMLEFGCYDDMVRFQRMLNNTQTPKTEQDIIYIGAYGPILETEKK